VSCAGIRVDPNDYTVLLADVLEACRTHDRAIIIGLILVIVQYGCHLENYSCGQSADNAERSSAAGKEQTLWSIRNLEMENYGEWRWYP